MLRWEVEQIFEKNKEEFLLNIQSSKLPTAILLGGQPACGKSYLTNKVIENNPDKNFLIVNYGSGESIEKNRA